MASHSENTHSKSIFRSKIARCLRIPDGADEISDVNEVAVIHSSDSEEAANLSSDSNNDETRAESPSQK